MNVASQLPPLVPVTVYVAVGPCGLFVVTVAIVPLAGLHVSDSPNWRGAGYGFSETVIVLALLAPRPSTATGFGLALSAPGTGVALGDGMGTVVVTRANHELTVALS